MGWKHKGLSLMREAGYLPVTIACSGNQGSSRVGAVVRDEAWGDRPTLWGKSARF